MSTTEARRKRKRNRAMPRFRSLKEESAFWDKHSFLDYGKWEVVPYEEVCRDLGSSKEPKLPVTLRLEKDLVRKLKQAAGRYGIKYQALAREILRRSLDR